MQKEVLNREVTSAKEKIQVLMQAAWRLWHNNARMIEKIGEPLPELKALIVLDHDGNIKCTSHSKLVTLYQSAMVQQLDEELEGANKRGHSNRVAQIHKS